MEGRHPIYGSAAEFIFLTANFRTYTFTDEHVKHMQFTLIPTLIAFFKRQAERGNAWVVDGFLWLLEFLAKADHPISKWMKRHHKFFEAGIEQLIQMYPKEKRAKSIPLEKLLFRNFNTMLGDTENILNLSHMFSAIETSLSEPDRVKPYVPAKVEYDFGILQEAVVKYLRDQIHKTFYIKYDRRGKTGHPIRPRVIPIHGAKADPAHMAGCFITSTGLMIMILLSATSDRCFVCLEEAHTSCEKCLMLHYCSDACQKKDKDRHKHECTFFKV